jgi:DNA polymerase III subunit delta
MSQPPSFYLLHGPDEFASAEYVAGLKEKMGDPSMASLNTTVFDGRTATLPELRSVCDTMPFLTKRRLVLVDGWLTKLLSKGEGDEADGAPAPASVKELLAALVAYLPELPETTALVFVEKRTLPASHAVLKAAVGKPWAFIKLFDTPKGPELANWIEKRAKAEGGSFAREAAQALGAVEDDPRALGNEITKLLTYVNFARPVTVADVEALSPVGGETKIFDMVDAIGQRRAQVATRELHKLLEKEDPLYVLGMIVRQYRLILQARELLDASQTENAVAQTLGLHPFPAGKICAQAKNMSLPVLEHIYHRLLDYDTDIKTGRTDPVSALEALVVSLTA